MNKKLLLIYILPILTGCTPVDWDGGLSERKYKLIFKTNDGEFVSGVEPYCYGNKISPSNEIAKEINKSSNVSNSNGEIKFGHSRFPYGGRYYQLGPIKFGDYKVPTVFCEFKYKQKVIESGELFKYLKPTVVIKI